MALSGPEANAILAEPKVITANVRWRQGKAPYKSYRLEASVLIPSRGELARVLGSVGRTNTSFVLLYGNEPLRRYDTHKRHRNPDGQVIAGPHKHTWREETEDQEAYVPQEPLSADPNGAFLEFLAECNIVLRGNYEPFML